MAPQRDRSMPDQSESIPHEPSPAAVPFGSREALLRGPKPRFVDVVLQGIDGSAKHRLRELKQGAVEEISQAAFKQEIAEDGKIRRLFDARGNKARYVAASLVYEDGAQYFANYMVEYALLNSALTPAQIDVLHKAVMKLNGLDEEARKDLGKVSGATDDSSASS